MYGGSYGLVYGYAMMSQPPSKHSRTLKDFFSSHREFPDEANAVTVSVSSASITTSTSGGDALVTFSPTVIVTGVPRGRYRGDDEGALRPLTFPSDIAQSTNDMPAQMILSRYPSTIIGDKTRSFQSSWFRSHPWLEYSVEKDSCYCYPVVYLIQTLLILHSPIHQVIMTGNMRPERKVPCLFTKLL